MAERQFQEYHSQVKPFFTIAIIEVLRSSLESECLEKRYINPKYYYYYTNHIRLGWYPMFNNLDLGPKKTWLRYLYMLVPSSSSGRSQCWHRCWWLELHYHNQGDQSVTMATTIVLSLNQVAGCGHGSRELLNDRLPKKYRLCRYRYSVIMLDIKITFQNDNHQFILSFTDSPDHACIVLNIHTWSCP